MKLTEKRKRSSKILGSYKFTHQPEHLAIYKSLTDFEERLDELKVLLNTPLLGPSTLTYAHYAPISDKLLQWKTLAKN